MTTEGEFGQAEPAMSTLQFAEVSETGSSAYTELSIEPFLLFDENLNCVSANTAVQKLFRVSEKDVVGKNIMEVVPNIKETGTYDEYVDMIRDGKSTVTHSRLGDLHLDLKAFKVGNGLGVILSDVTERKHTKSDGYNVEQRLDLTGRLVALSDLAANIASELTTLAGEQEVLKEPKAVRGSNHEESAHGLKAGFHSRELSGYLGELDRAMSQLAGFKEKVDLEEAYLQMARTLAMMSETREPYLRGHSERVGMLANEIAVWLGCPAEQIRDIQMAAILHDIGKIVIPDYILFKPGDLTPDEYSEVRRHPQAAVELLRTLNYFDGIIPIIESHHEWYNGMGYPNKIKQDDIHMGARILAVADAYDAMTSSRPYRSRFSSEQAIRVLRDGAGTQWDPMIVYAFLEMVDPEFEKLRMVEEEKVEGSAEREDKRWVAPESLENHNEVKEKAAEALQRAEHWANWMENMDTSKTKRGKKLG